MHSTVGTRENEDKRDRKSLRNWSISTHTRLTRSSRALLENKDEGQSFFFGKVKLIFLGKMTSTS